MPDPYRVLLIATNVEREPYPVYPIGAAIIASVLEERGFNVRGLDFTFLDDPLDCVEDVMLSFHPDLVGISVRAVDTTCSLDPRSYIPPIAELISGIKAKHELPVVVGGAGYSLFPELLLQVLGADYGVVGEGEETAAELLTHLAAGTDPAGTPGLLVRQGAIVTSAPPRRPSPVGMWRAPTSGVFSFQPHLDAGGMASVQTKRGCPMACTYCTYPNLEGKGFRLREAADVAREVRDLVDLGVDYLFFVDNNFNLPASHAAEVCRHLAEIDDRPEWTAFLTPYGFEAELAGLMASAGARSLEFGSESGAVEVLRGLGKHHSPEDILDCDKLCSEADLTPAHYFIFGGPGETLDSVQHSLDLIGRLSGPVVAMLGIRVYPNTALHQRAITEGVVAVDDPLLDPAYYISPGVDPEQMLQQLTDCASTRNNFVVLGTENRLQRDLIQRLRKHGRRGPLWEFMRA